LTPGGKSPQMSDSGVHEKNIRGYLAGKFWQDSGLILALNGVGLLLGYVVHLALVKWMGGTEYGKLSYANSVAALAGVLVSLGLPVTAVRLVPEYGARGAFAELKGFWRFGGWTVFLVSALAGAGLAWLNGRHHLFSAVEPEVMAVVLLLGLPLSTMLGWQTELFRAQRRIRPVVWWQHALSPILLLMLAGWAFWMQGMLSAITVLLLMAFLAFVGWLAMAGWQAVNWGRQFRTTPACFSVGDWGRISLPICLTGMFLVLMAQIDILLIGSMLGARQAGIYALAAKLAALTSLVLNAVNVLAAPVYAQLYAENRREQMIRFARMLSHAIFWPALAIALLLMVAGYPVLNWFGREFATGYGVMTLLIAGQLVNAGAGSVGFLADVTGLQLPAAFVRGGCALLNLVLSWVLIRSMGMMGAAIATTFCLALWNVLLHRLVSSRRGISPSIWSTMVDVWRT